MGDINVCQVVARETNRTNANFVLGLNKNDYLISEEHSCFQIHVG